MQDTAPSEIEDGVITAVRIYDRFISAFAQVEYDYSKLINDAGGKEAAEAYGSVEMSVALANIERYFTQECG